MSRVYDALRRAEGDGSAPVETVAEGRPDEYPYSSMRGSTAVNPPSVKRNIHPGLLQEVPVVPFQRAPESHLLDLSASHETPAEEFRTLRTRLNHFQTLQTLHTIVVTSPSPAEGKTFTAVNLAVAEAQLAESSVLLADFDLRRPVVHNLFQVERAPGLSD